MKEKCCVSQVESEVIEAWCREINIYDEDCMVWPCGTA